MEQKTTVSAEDDKQELLIRRDFDLPVHLLFKAYADAELVEQWMGTKVLELESKNYGRYRFETSNALGKVVFGAHGVIHAFVPNQKIIRTFEMDNAPFGVQIEVYAFEALTGDASRLRMHLIFESVAFRDGMLRVGAGMAKGLSMAHDRLQNAAAKLK